MSKKNKTNLATEEMKVEAEPAVAAAKASTKVKKEAKQPKKAKKEKKHLIKKKTKETVSELKKVTWPTFAHVVKKTGVVLVVVIVFAVLLFGIDSFFGFLFGLLTGGNG